MSDIVTAPPQPRPTPRSRAFTREVWVERLARFPNSGLTNRKSVSVQFSGRTSGRKTELTPISLELTPISLTNFPHQFP
jgi:hypothetical protein